MLALSTLFQSSEIGLGQKGRLKASEFPSMCECRMFNRTRVVELRDLAQSHFDMSLNCGWVSPDLAQAALVRFRHPRNQCMRRFTSNFISSIAPGGVRRVLPSCLF
jgi:hypothetical protein